MSRKFQKIRLRVNLKMPFERAHDIIHDKLRNLESLTSGTFTSSAETGRTAGRHGRVRKGLGPERLDRSRHGSLREMAAGPGVVRGGVRILPTGRETSDIVIELRKNDPGAGHRGQLDRYLLRKLAWDIFERFFKDNREAA